MVKLIEPLINQQASLNNKTTETEDQKLLEEVKKPLGVPADNKLPATS